MLDKLRAVENRYEELCARSEQPDFYNDPQKAANLLREKNDLLSVIFEPDGRNLVLVSRLLNSVIVFDTCRMSVRATYKVHGNIIGIHSISDTSVRLFCDSVPINVCINLNLTGE